MVRAIEDALRRGRAGGAPGGGRGGELSGSGCGVGTPTTRTIPAAQASRSVDGPRTRASRARRVGLPWAGDCRDLFSHWCVAGWAMRRIVCARSRRGFALRRGTRRQHILAGWPVPIAEWALQSRHAQAVVRVLALLVGSWTLVAMGSFLPFGPGSDAITYLGSARGSTPATPFTRVDRGLGPNPQAAVFVTRSCRHRHLLQRYGGRWPSWAICRWCCGGWPASSRSCCSSAAFRSRSPIMGAAGIAILSSVPLKQELMAGNVNGLLMGGVLATWLLQRGGHDRAAGALVALMAAIKVWPVVLPMVHRPTTMAIGGGIPRRRSHHRGRDRVGAGVGSCLAYLGIARAFIAPARSPSRPTPGCPGSGTRSLRSARS